MSEKFIVRKAEKNDIAEIQTLIKGLATYEKRPQDMTASQEDLCYWIFEKKIATVLIAEYNEEIIGYAIYYPIFGSFAAEAGVHLEDVLLNEKYRHCGLGRKFFSKIEEFVKEDGYSKMEWSCLAVDFRVRTNFRKHSLRNVEDFQNLIIPFKILDVIEHSTSCV